jgi:hypothetical protein
MSFETAAIGWALARSAVLERATDVGARRYQSATRALIQKIDEMTAGPQRHSPEYLAAVEHQTVEMVNAELVKFLAKHAAVASKFALTRQPWPSPSKSTGTHQRRCRRQHAVPLRAAPRNESSSFLETHGNA